MSYIHIYITTCIYIHVYIRREAECVWFHSVNRPNDVGYLPEHGAKRQLYTQWAEQGCAYGQYLLGECHWYGWGYALKDFKRAAALYRMSADQGHSRGQFRLGHCYYKGRGVSMDKDVAIQWWARAAAQGHESAKSWLKQESVKCVSNSPSLWQRITQNREKAVTDRKQR